MAQKTIKGFSRKGLSGRWIISNIHQYEHFLETIGCAGFIIDTSFKIKTINESACCLINKSRRQMEGAFCYEALWNRSAHCPGCPARLAINSMAKIEKNLVLTVDGNKKVLLCTAYPIVNRKGSIDGVACYLLDITSVREIEEALADSQKQLAAVINSVYQGLAILKDRTFLWVNEAMVKIFGYSREEFIGQTTRMLYFDEQSYIDAGHDYYPNIKQAGYHLGDLKFRHRDGKPVYCIVNATLIDPENPQEGIVFVFTDISEREKHARALRESEEKYRTLVESSDNIIFTVNREFMVMTSNRVMEKWLGQSITNINGRHIQEILPPELADLFSQELEQVFSKENGSRFESSTGCGEERQWYVTILSPVKNHAQEIVHVLVIIQDITSLKSAEEALLRQEVAQAIHQRLAALGQVAAGMAHEIRNPLTAVKGFCQLLRGRMQEQSSLDYLQVVLEEIDRIDNILTEFLQFARPLPPKREWVCLNSLIQNVGMLVEAQCQVNNIVVRCKVDPLLPGLMIDRGQIQQVVLNLVQNAIRAMTNTAKKELNISTSYFHKIEQVVITVEDTGIGIPNHHMEQLGTPFFTTWDDGHGLGLSVSYRLIEAHDGRIEISSEPGRGSKFMVFLPCATSC